MSVDVGSGHTKSDPNVVPLCDILLVLLIIFMVITPVMQKGIDAKLPESDTSGGPVSANTIVLTIEQDTSSIKINQESIETSLLEGRLRDLYQSRQDKTIFIRADDSAPYKDVLKILDIAKGAGIEVLGLVTEHYSKGK
jgi:biopolymer transport protein TolR